MQINIDRSKLFQKGDVRILIRSEPDFMYNLNPGHSNLSAEFFGKIKEEVEIPEKTFFVPKYMKT